MLRGGSCAGAYFDEADDEANADTTDTANTACQQRNRILLAARVMEEDCIIIPFVID